jgi:hypothetical protein
MTDRRCHDSIWMVGKGWAKDSKGFWKRGGRFVPVIPVIGVEAQT